MSISLNYFKEFVKINLEQQRIVKIVMLSKNDYYFSLLPLKRVLHISLNFPSPFIELIDSLPFTDKLETSLILNNIKKHLSSAKIIVTEIYNDDKIIKFKYKKTYENYEIMFGNVFIEFITNHPNIIITDDNLKIICATHYTSLVAERVIRPNLTYVGQDKTNIVKKITQNDDIGIINKYNESIILKNIKERFSPIFKVIKSKIKQLSKRALFLQETINNCNNFNDYKDIGDYIYTYMDSIKDNSFMFNEKLIILDPSISLIDNANKYYKKYHKLKTGLDINKDFLNKALNDLKYYENIQFQINNADIESIIEIENELYNLKVIDKKSTKKPISSAKPYHFNFKETDIYFGKNNMQNENLTFNLAKKNYYYFHCKDYHGSHVIAFSSNPDKDVIRLCCELALYLSSLKCGEVILSDVKDVKKTPVRGLVNILKYNTIEIKSYDEELIKSYVAKSIR